jgi:hypothetical protein
MVFLLLAFGLLPSFNNSVGAAEAFIRIVVRRLATDAAYP